MQSKPRSFLGRLGESVFHKPDTHLILLCTLFLAAFAIRVYHIGQPPLDFSPTRQYFSAIIARGLFFQVSPSVPEWQRQVAITNRQTLGSIEPPIMELLATLAYRIVGGEHLWIPRLFSVIFWLGGGVFLYAITRELLSKDGALFSVAFYLFLPYAVAASRSFQPDPLMVFAFLSSIWAIVRYYTRPSSARLVIAAVLSAFAVLVKPMCVFPIFTVLIAASISTQGIRKTLTSRRLALFSIVTLLPPALYYGYGIFVAGFLQRNVAMSFVPSLYLSKMFWGGWLRRIIAVVGLTAPIVGLLGVLLFPSGLSRATVVGLWAGYALFGLVFDYHISTHDYYQLQFIPIVALSIAPIFALIARALIRASAQWHWRLALVGVVLFASGLCLREIRSTLGTPNVSQISVAQEVGAATQHSMKTIFLAPYYGFPLQYYADISGEWWPRTGDLRLETLQGKPPITAKERLDSLIARLSPQYFIVTDFEEFAVQSDLKQLLEETYPVVQQTPTYVIFDLTKEK